MPMRKHSSVLLLAALLLSACQEVPDRRPLGPVDEPFNRAGAAKLQDSLRAVVTPGTFRARLFGDPMRRDLDEAAVGTDLDGPATFRTERAADGRPLTLRLTLEGTGQRTVHLEWQTDVFDDARDYVRAAEGQTMTINQDLQGNRPTVSADLRAKRKPFASRSGTVTIVDADSTRLRGSFFFEMKSPEAGAEDWFSLVGAFEATRGS